MPVKMYVRRVACVLFNSISKTKKKKKGRNVDKKEKGLIML